MIRFRCCAATVFVLLLLRSSGVIEEKFRNWVSEYFEFQDFSGFWNLDVTCKRVKAV